MAFDGVRFLTLDPATCLPTGEVAENLPPSSQAGDELCTMLISEAAPWGALTLGRGAEREPFTPADAAVVASLSPHLAAGVRRAILRSAVCARPHADGTRPGLALLAADDSIVMADPAGERWLTELPAPVVPAVAGRARGGDAALAHARVPTPTGAWLIVRGSRLAGYGDAHTAVTFEPAQSHDLVPLVADAYELTERERAVTQLIAQGLATAAIAARLHLSPWTVQDHLKSIFEKVGAASRGEVVARVFFGHAPP